jgi:hypothetical protein
MKPTRAWKTAAVAGSVLLAGGYVAWRSARASERPAPTAPPAVASPVVPPIDGLMPGTKTMVLDVPQAEPSEEEKRRKELEEAAARGMFYGSKSMPLELGDPPSAPPEPAKE